MTGFARAQGYDDGCSWAWEIKSVNGKGLDVRFRLPYGFEALEPGARERIAARFRRGNVQGSLQVSRAESQARFRINADVLEEVIALLPEIQRRLPEARAPSIDGLLGLRGVIEPVDDAAGQAAAREALEDALLAGLEVAIDQLAATRRDEGGRLAAVIEDHLTAIARLSAKAEALAATQPDAIRQRLNEQVAALIEAVPALPEERLAQEAALLMTKADVREELDRLAAHLEAARALMAEGGAVGRRLDFLCQEFNREANTLCSKSIDVELTRIGLDLKAAVEQLREQVQNVE